MSTRQAHVIIRGRVQGVWFRQSTLKTATGLGLAGWVRNLASGEVEALFEGKEPAVEQMLQWCRSGPPLAKVTDIEVNRQPATGLAAPFETRPTAPSKGTRGTE